MARACVYKDNKGKSELIGFTVFEVNVKQPTRVIGAPIETGEVAIDNKVIDPMMITVTGTVVANGSEHNTLDWLGYMLMNRDYQFYSVCDGSSTYNNLILKTLPFKRTSEKVDFINFELEFVEAMIVQGTTAKSSNSENSSTRSSGPIHSA